MLSFHRPGLTAVHRTTPHASSIYLLSVLTRTLFQLEWVSIHKTYYRLFLHRYANLVKIGGSTAELFHAFDYQNGGRSPSWIFIFSQ